MTTRRRSVAPALLGTLLGLHATALLCASGAAALLGASSAAAADFPNKPIRLVVPYPPGGPTDVLARIIAQELSARLGQQVVIDNKPGASGTIGADLVAKAPADGYTILANASIHVIVPALYPKLAFDAIKDFAPVSLIADVPLVVVVPETSAPRSIAELIALAKSKAAAGTPISFASSGNAAAQHLAGEAFKIATGVQMTHVPYKGSSPALTDLIGGHVQVMFDSMPSAMPHIKSGKLRALAVTTGKRSAGLPDTPTVIESGVSDFEFSTWYGIWAPVGTPAPIVDALSQAVAAIVRQSGVRAD